MENMIENELHVVFGASGGIGNAVIRALVSQGKRVRGVNRSGKAKVPEVVEMVSANLLDLETSVKVSEGATHIYNCVNVVYTKWKEIYPEIAYKFRDLLKLTKAKGIIADNLYMYDEEVMEPLSESMEYLAKGKKGKLRSNVSRIYEQAMEAGEIQAVICRAPDFYGPGVTLSSFYGDRIFKPILEGKNVSVLGNLDVPHAIIFVDDFAKALITLAQNENANGQIWHAPLDKTLTQREFLELIYKEAGTTGKIRKVSRRITSIMGKLVPLIREINEMMYEFVNPYQVNTLKYEEKFGNGVTPHSIAIRKTLEWYKLNYI